MLKALKNRGLLAIAYKFRKASTFSVVSLSLLFTFFLSSKTFAMSADTLVSLTNQQRNQAGLSSLTISPELTRSAQAKAQDMLSRNYWAHFAPDGTSPWFFMDQTGYKYKRAGENLAMDFATDNDVMTGWMNSPTHRDNMLKADYHDIGIAVVEGQLLGHQTILVVAHYGTPVASSVPAPVAQTAAVAPSIQPQPVQAATAVNKTTSTPQPVKTTVNRSKKELKTPIVESSAYSLLAFTLTGAWLAPALYYLKG